MQKSLIYKQPHTTEKTKTKKNKLATDQTFTSSYFFDFMGYLEQSA